MTPPGDQGLSREGLEALYTRLERPLYNVVYRWVWDDQEALDLVQEAFLRLWRMRRRVQVATVEPLVYRIALNLASNRRRTRRLWRWVALDALAQQRDPTPDATTSLVARQTSERIRQAIDALPDRLRRVVVLSELAQMSYAEIASTLGIPEGTVASRRHTAIRRLREQLAKD